MKPRAVLLGSGGVLVQLATISWCGLALVRTYHPGDEPHPIAGAEQGHVEYQLTRDGWAEHRVQPVVST